MDGSGRVLHNVFVERLWRTVKYEDTYLQGYATGPELHGGLSDYLRRGRRRRRCAPPDIRASC